MIIIMSLSTVTNLADLFDPGSFDVILSMAVNFLCVLIHILIKINIPQKVVGLGHLVGGEGGWLRVWGCKPVGHLGGGVGAKQSIQRNPLQLKDQHHVVIINNNNN